MGVAKQIAAKFQVADGWTQRGGVPSELTAQTI
jgi:hypothetical protein